MQAPCGPLSKSFVGLHVAYPAVGSADRHKPQVQKERGLGGSRVLQLDCAVFGMFSSCEATLSETEFFNSWWNKVGVFFISQTATKHGVMIGVFLFVCCLGPEV